MMSIGANWRRDLAFGLILLAVAAVIPFLGPSRYHMGQLTLFFIWATVVSQWNLVFGVAGVFSLAQMAIFAFGGFATGMMGLYLGWSLWAALPVAAFGAVLFSILIGLACLRLRGAYVALLTLAISQVMLLLIETDTACFTMEGVTCRNFTGGSRGLYGFGDFGFRELLGRQNYARGDYYLSLILLMLATGFSFVIIRSPLGFAFRALRDNPEYGVSRGLNQFKYQLLVFAMSAFFTGLAGGVFAGWGPILGTALVMLADEGMKDFVEIRNLGYGALIIVFVVLLPQGVAGTIEQVWGRGKRWLGGPRETHRPEPGG
jgi:branched-chain amino acid transport system permease protein